MRSLVVTLAVVSLALSLTSPARAGVASIGSSFGFGYFRGPYGEDLGLLSAPTQTVGLVAFQPGLRLAQSLDARRHTSLVLDAGLLLIEQDGSSLHALQLMGSCQVAFGDRANAPFLEAGIGVNQNGGEGEGESPLVIGGGLGMRHRLAHGHGAMRTEVRFDHQFETGEGGFLGTPAIDGVSLRVGFDLDLD